MRIWCFLVILALGATQAKAQEALDFVELFLGGACGPTTIGQTVNLRNTHDNTAIAVDVEITTHSFKPDVVTVLPFTVAPQAELFIDCNWPFIGVWRSFEILDAEFDCAPYLFLWCPDTGQPSSFVNGCNVQINGGTHPVCGPSLLNGAWDWGDGSIPAASFFPAQHEYSTSGLYTATLTIETFTEQCLINVTDCPADTDEDGVRDDTDNCRLVANLDQRDTDGDGHGNRCDGDLNNDCIVNIIDLGIFRSRYFSNDTHADFNGDGQVNALDLGIFRSLFLAPPGVGAPGALCD